MNGMLIRKAHEDDFDGIWQIFHEVVSRGDTYTYEPETTREQAHEIWMSPSGATYVACVGPDILGTYILRPNQPGLGSHVANAAYMVAGKARGRGAGRAMCEHSLEEARRLNYQAMQFNFVVSTNVAAVALWMDCGFSIVGTLPKAFRHPQAGLVDAYVMHRFL
jgi:L-amino acid N-acyltransferase YncA